MITLTNGESFDALAPGARVIKAILSGIDGDRWGKNEALPATAKLAEEFGVDRKTVLRAVHELQERGVLRVRGRRIYVHQAINGKAQDLLSRTVCVVGSNGGILHSAQRRDRAPGWSDRVMMGILAGISEASNNAMVLQSGDVGRIGQPGQVPRGVVVSDTAKMDPAALRSEMSRMRRQDIPVSAYADLIDAPDCDTVASDHYRGAYELTRWLLDHGRRTIVPVWEEAARNEPWLQQRYNGYAAAMIAGEAWPAEPVWVPSMPHTRDDADAFESAARMLAGHLVELFRENACPDALMVVSDRLAYGVAAACRLFGKVPHRDVWLTGYDNYWQDCCERLLEPCGPQVTIDKRNEAIGRELVHLVLERAEMENGGKPVHRMIEPALIEIRPEA